MYRSHIAVQAVTQFSIPILIIITFPVLEFSWHSRNTNDMSLLVPRIKRLCKMLELFYSKKKIEIKRMVIKEQNNQLANQHLQFNLST